MAKIFLVPINLNQNELQNGVVQNLSSDPGSPVEGQIYWNTTSHVLKMYTGSAWDVIGRLDQISAPTADVSLNSHKLTNVTDPGAAQDAATQNYVLGRSLSAFAVPTADVAWNAKKITGLADPSSAQDAATKAYVDGAVNGLSWHAAVRVASTANLAVASAVVNGATVDGVTLATGDRILLKNQATPAENGIYIVAAAGAASRATDADSAAEVLQLAVAVEEGTAGADTFWVGTANGTISLGSTGLPFAQFGAGATYTNGTGLSLTGNSFSIENSGVLLPAHGGTGVASPTVHYLLIGAGASAMTALAPGSQYTTLQSAGASADPAYDAVHLDQAAAVTGTLPLGNGGTGGNSAANAKTSLGFMTRYAASFGDGAATSYTITHSLGTLDVHVEVFRNSDGVKVECDVTHTSTTIVTLAFAVAPTSNQYRVVVIG